MDKRGSVFLWFLLGIVTIIFVVFVIFIFIGNDSNASENEEIAETDSGNQENIQEDTSGESTSENIEECLGYSGQEDCEQDSFSVAQTNCEEGEECTCFWDVNNSVCNLLIKAEVEVQETFFDLEVLSVTAEDGGCETIVGNETNTTSCTIDSFGTLKNSGTATINERFVVQFLAVLQSGDTTLIDAIGVEETLAPNDEKQLSATYTNISHGEYFVRFVVDAVSNIDEINEDNNARSAFIKI